MIGFDFFFVRRVACIFFIRFRARCACLCCCIRLRRRFLWVLFFTIRAVSLMLFGRLLLFVNRCVGFGSFE